MPAIPTPLTRSLVVLFLCGLLLTLAGCAKKQTMSPAAWRSKLREAISASVTTRDQRNKHSRLMEQALEEGALDGLTQPEVQAALGRATTCAGKDVCSDNGFRSGDWYYEVGEMGDEDKVKQLPILVIGFGPKGHVIRTWTMTTH